MMSFDLYQNIDLGMFNVTGITPSKFFGVVVTFGVDPSGMVYITATEKMTGKSLRGRKKILVSLH